MGDSAAGLQRTGNNPRCCQMDSRPAWLAGGIAVGYVSLSLLWGPGLTQLPFWIACAGIAVFVALSDVDLRPGIAGAMLGAIGLQLHLDPNFWGGFGNENFIAEFVIVCMAFLWWPFWIIGAAYLLFLNGSDIKWVALGGIVVWWLIQRRAYWLVAFVVLLPVNVLLLWDAPRTVEISVMERAELWWNSLQVWLEAPITGVGLGGFDYWYPLHQEAHLWFRDETILRGAHVIAGAAHNEYLQVLAEFGLIGAALVAWFLRELRWNAPIVAVLAISVVSFPLQTPATAALFCVACGYSLRSPAYSLDYSATGLLSGLRQLASMPGATLTKRLRQIMKPFGNIPTRFSGGT